MATPKTTTSRGVKQDRRLVAGSQDREVRYEADKLGAPKADVKTAIAKSGNSRAAVEKTLKKR